MIWPLPGIAWIGAPLYDQVTVFVSVMITEPLSVTCRVQGGMPMLALLKSAITFPLASCAWTLQFWVHATHQTLPD